MKRFISAIIPILVWSTTEHSTNFVEANKDVTWKAINKTRAVIIVSDKQTWISFNDAPLVDIPDLHPLSVEDAYNNYALHYDDNTSRENQVQPFSFLSPYVDPLCVVQGKAFRATVHGSFNISCSPHHVHHAPACCMLSVSSARPHQ